MAKLIDPERYKTILQRFEELLTEVGKLEAAEAARSLIKGLQIAPTVDAVEVVRCKDCREWLRNRGVVDSPNGHCFYHETHMNGYDFCSYGERRSDA